MYKSSVLQMSSICSCTRVCLYQCVCGKRGIVSRLEVDGANRGGKLCDYLEMLSIIITM